MSTPELTKEEVREYWELRLALFAPGDDIVCTPVRREMVREILFMFTTLDAVQRERDDTVKEGLRLTVELEQRTEERDTCYDKDSGKTREINILTKETSDLCADRDRLTAQVQALQVSLYSTLLDLGVVEQERDALRTEVEDLRSQLAQRRVSVPFPYQRDAPPREE